MKKILISLCFMAAVFTVKAQTNELILNGTPVHNGDRLEYVYGFNMTVNSDTSAKVVTVTYVGITNEYLMPINWLVGKNWKPLKVKWFNYNKKGIRVLGTQIIVYVKAK